jgi:subtilase family serine protease
MAMRIAGLVPLVAIALVAITLTAGYATDRVTLSGNHPREAETMTPVGDAYPNQRLSMEIHFATRNQAELNQLLAEQQNPASPNFHKWLKPGDFDSRFGARQSDIDAVADWLRGEGFTVESTSGGYIRFSGSVAQAERTFGTRIERFGNGSTYANVNDPSIPARFAGVIGNIGGLDNMMRAVPVGPHFAAPSHR